VEGYGVAKKKEKLKMNLKKRKAATLKALETKDVLPPQ